MNNSHLYSTVRKIILIIIVGMLTSNCSHSLTDGTNSITSDPFEKYNRITHNFNKTVDRGALLPASKIYGGSVPQSFRLGAASFHGNLQEPKRFANHLVQLQFRKASVDLSRFVINSTIGLLGLFDAASWLELFPEKTNFDETFASWSIPTGPYLEIPLLGPSSVRGSFSIFADYTVNPLLMLPGPIPSISFATFEIVNIINNRYQYSQAINSILYNSSDSYSSTRLTYLQKLKSIDQAQEELPIELFDPFAEY